MCITSDDDDSMQAFRQDVEGSVESKHQYDVAKVLHSLGVDHTLNHVTSDGLFCADILIKGHDVLVQVDGPHHWTTNTGQPIGETCCLLCSRPSNCSLLHIAFVIPESGSSSCLVSSVGRRLVIGAS